MVRFAAWDERLRGEISRIIGHLHRLSEGSQLAFGFYDILGMDDHCYGPNDPSIICVSALPNDPNVERLAEDQRKGRPCAVIMRTEDRQKWRELSEAHKTHPLLFVIATGGPREQLKSMFPGITVESVQDFEEPFDRLIAQYIYARVSRTPAPAET